MREMVISVKSVISLEMVFVLRCLCFCIRKNTYQSVLLCLVK